MCSIVCITNIKKQINKQIEIKASYVGRTWLPTIFVAHFADFDAVAAIIYLKVQLCFEFVIFFCFLLSYLNLENYIIFRFFYAYLYISVTYYYSFSYYNFRKLVSFLYFYETGGYGGLRIVKME